MATLPEMPIEMTNCRMLVKIWKTVLFSYIYIKIKYIKYIFNSLKFIQVFSFLQLMFFLRLVRIYFLIIH